MSSEVERAAAEREAQLAEARLRDYHQGTSSWWSDPDATASKDADREVGPVSEKQQEAARQMSSDPVERKWPGYADEIKRQNQLETLRAQYPDFVISEPEPLEDRTGDETDEAQP